MAAFAAACLCLAACNRGDLKHDLVKPATLTKITLEQDVSYTTVRGIGATWMEGLKAGGYIAEAENEHGTFYRGSGKCVSDLMASKPNYQFEGGIWLPKEAAEKPKIYYYFNADLDTVEKGGGPVVYAIVAASIGDLTFVPDYIEDPAIVAQLKPQPAQ